LTNKILFYFKDVLKTYFCPKISKEKFCRIHEHENPSLYHKSKIFGRTHFGEAACEDPIMYQEG
jgi:hypothetical protein